MNTIRINPSLTDKKRRELIFEGNFIVHSSMPSLKRLTEHAQLLIREAFNELDPEKAQYEMGVEDFVKIVSPLKSKFTNDLKTKELIKEILLEFGMDVNKTYFDVPRLRVVTSDNYLTAGVGYAYKAHRDTWYSSPEAQVNWWLPVFDLDAENTMSLYPGYWDMKIQNSSNDFDYDEWCKTGRVLAATQTSVDTRKHPLPTEAINAETETRFVLSSGEVMLFSATQLHATAPNRSGRTRFSMDFRTINIDDINDRSGAKNIDNHSKGTTLGDFISANDFKAIDPEIITRFLHLKTV